MENIGVVYPLPKKLADNILVKKKDVFIKFLTHESKNTRLKKNFKFLIYVSGKDKSIEGEAKIKKIEFLKLKELVKRYSNRLFLSKKDLKKYSKFREDKLLLVISLKDIKKYYQSVKSQFPMTPAGKYLTKKNYSDILK